MNRADELARLIEQSNELGWLQHASCADLGVEQLELFFVEAGKTLARSGVSSSPTD